MARASRLGGGLLASMLTGEDGKQVLVMPLFAEIVDYSVVRNQIKIRIKKALYITEHKDKNHDSTNLVEER